MIAQAQGHARLQHFSARRNNYKNLARLLSATALLLAIIGQSGCSGTVGASRLASSNFISGLNPSASALSFGNVNLGAMSTLGVTFTNTTTSNVTVSNVTMAGAGFSISGLSNGLNLAPGASVTMNVSFAPAGVGATTGIITLTDTGSNPTITIALSGTGISGHKATLWWSASSSSNVFGYYVYRGTTTGGPYFRLNGSAPNQGTSSVDASVQSGQTYYYVVTAVDVFGFESSFSNEVSAPIP